MIPRIEDGLAWWTREIS